MHKLFICTLSLLNLTLCGCKVIYGIKEQTKIDPVKIERFYSSIQTDKPFQKAILDSSYSENLLKTCSDSILTKHHIQPLQALYFDSTGRLISFHVNCNASGFPDLKWNGQGSFIQFPPITQTECDTVFNYISLTNYFSQKMTISKAPKYSVVVFWNFLFERQSKRLIKQVLDNLPTDTSAYQLVLVNNDELFINSID